MRIDLSKATFELKNGPLLGEYLHITPEGYCQEEARNVSYQVRRNGTVVRAICGVPMDEPVDQSTAQEILRHARVKEYLKEKQG